MIKRVLQILFLLINVTCFSQVSEQYFSDSCYIGAMNGLAVKHRSFVFAGATVYDNGQRLVLCKINANGDTVWSTSQPSYYEERFISLTTSQEGDIYALIGIPENFGKYNKYFIWKVEGNTGKVKWIYSHESNEYSVCIKDFDTVKVILLQTLTSKIKLIPISKKTGIADSAFYINKAISLKMIAFDSAKYMYFHKSVDTLIKVSYNKPDSIIWQKKFQRTSSEDYFNSIIIDSMGRFFLISSKSGYSQIAKINQWTGDTIFTRKLPDKYLWYVDAGNDMYLTFDNIDHVKNVVRVNKNSGVTKIISLPDNQSLDADSLGNIYYVCLYGPYGSIPYYCIYRWNEPGGTTEYITRIYNYKGLPNMSPNYCKVFYQNKKLLVFASLPTLTTLNQRAMSLLLAQVDPATKKVVSLKDFWTIYRFPSQVKTILNTDNGVVVAKQLGNYIELDKYNNNDSLIWRRTIKHQNNLFLKAITTNPAGQIVVYSYSIYLTEVFPYYDSLDYEDSLIVTVYNKDGIQLWRQASYHYIDNLVQMLVNDNICYLLLKTNGKIISRTITRERFWDVTDLGIPYDNAMRSPAADMGTEGWIMVVKRNNLNVELIIPGGGVHPYFFDDFEPTNADNIIKMLRLNASRYVAASRTRLYMYDHYTRKSVWSFDYTTTTYPITDMAIDTGNKVAYILIPKGNSIQIGKIDLQNGKQLSSLTYTASAATSVDVRTISYSNHTDELLLAGELKTTNLPGKRFFLSVTPDMTISDSLVESADSGSNYFSSFICSANGDYWLGGTVFRNNTGYSGVVVHKLKFRNLKLPESPALLSAAVFPNPSPDFITVVTDVPEGRIDILSIAGMLCWSQQFNTCNPRIDVTGLNTGIYIIKITNKQGIIQYTRFTKI